MPTRWRIDRKADVLRGLGVWWDTGFDPLEVPGFVDPFVAVRERLAQEVRP